ncbi:YopX family protein [Psychrobacillus sp. FJAT-21963]|uniref:YopX family protein n=1 Tax=Psychrobacillus sp. FJAT-21963 TaxID=1712028 RepID=UPI0006F77590|nr:YopX family protein [Psychrobacillus sp. FJAT-21963]
MSKIKFRFFRTKVKEMVYGFEGCSVTYVLGLWDTEKHVSELMQYTGLKDKNYIDIFKGDIAKREFDIWKTEYAYDGSPLGDECIEEGYFIGVVSQTPSGLYVLNKCRKYDAEGNFVKKCSGIKLFAHRCEVIGNIYEHPHLLEVAQ